MALSAAITPAIRSMLEEVLHGARPDSQYALYFLGDIVAEREPEEALAVTNWLLKAIQLGVSIDRALVLAAVQDIVRRFRSHPLFVAAIAAYENESGLLFVASPDERTRRQAISSLEELRRGAPARRRSE